MYKSSSHMHSKFSHDGDNTMEEMVVAAIAKGLEAVTFTEHFDIDNVEADYRDYNYAAYSNEVERLNEKYGDSITVLRGIELGSPHKYGTILDDILANEYDFVLGSVHLLNGKSIAHGCCEGIADNKAYYEEMLHLTTVKGIDAVGHFDHIRRGTGLDYYEDSVLADIFKNMVANNIALEVNTSGIRRIKGEPFPTYSKVEAYLACGGERLTIGCDSHRVHEISDGYAETSVRLSSLAGAKVGYYKAHNFIEIANKG